MHFYYISMSCWVLLERVGYFLFEREREREWEASELLCQISATTNFQ